MINYIDLEKAFDSVFRLAALGTFSDLPSNSPKRSPRFSPGYEGTENMFCFLNNKVRVYFIVCTTIMSHI